MPNVTMHIDDELLKKARKLAIDKDTSISEMFRLYLSDLVKKEETRNEYLADELDRLFASSLAASEGKSWTREELHDR